jgi:hypothetical protein
MAVDRIGEAKAELKQMAKGALFKMVFFSRVIDGLKIQSFL